VSTRTYIDQPVGVAAFASTNPEAPQSPRSLRFVLHPAQETLADNYYAGFCKVGDDKEVTVCRGQVVTITLKDLPQLGVTFQPWENKRQSEEIPDVVELGPSSSPPKAVISQPGVVPHQRMFSLPLLTSRASPSQLGLSTATADALPEVPIPEPSYDIFFSFRLEESRDEAKELQAMIERTRPGVKCFRSGDNPNGADLGIIIPTALANAKMAIIMGSKTYGKKTESNFSTYEEMHFILREREEKPMFLLKMCEEWEEPQTRLMMGSRKFKRWEDGQVTQALVDEILTRYDTIARAG